MNLKGVNSSSLADLIQAVLMWDWKRTFSTLFLFWEAWALTGGVSAGGYWLPRRRPSQDKRMSSHPAPNLPGKHCWSLQPLGAHTSHQISPSGSRDALWAVGLKFKASPGRGGPGTRGGRRSPPSFPTSAGSCWGGVKPSSINPARGICNIHTAQEFRSWLQSRSAQTSCPGSDKSPADTSPRLFRQLRCCKAQRMCVLVWLLQGVQPKGDPRPGGGDPL